VVLTEHSPVNLNYRNARPVSFPQSHIRIDIDYVDACATTHQWRELFEQQLA